MVGTAALLALVTFITFGGNWLLGQSMLDRPIVVGSLVGLVLGDVEQGVLIGAALEAVFMGAVNIGGAVSANPCVGTVFGAGFAIILGGGNEVALALALPIGILAAYVETLMNVVMSIFAPTYDRLAAEGNDKAIFRMHYSLWVLKFSVFPIIVFISVLIGSSAVEVFVNSIPEVIMNGLQVCGGLLPAVGVAILLKMLWTNSLAIYYFLGFLAVAYLNIPLIALAGFGLIFVITMGMNDFRFTKLNTVTTDKVELSEEDEFFG
ncbi:PTS mannnose transporter subunit IIC [Enterococcus sp. JM4C]|uniref:PTS mannose/fructose/sorbose/N-acetylgalactosamine transporter subunit IIC n=1 Tax=Candidatus Enterococcus huntleyi TaxID=1857217 RepID=UPI00137B8D63|nr:PTS sugar transporter subunit IIC [Enterococcus sp. JM4C]KAF1295205.1 PTS mannnose transporter subunit IIC [Enterococcus sp. JM4C]